MYLDFPSRATASALLALMLLSPALQAQRPAPARPRTQQRPAAQAPAPAPAPAVPMGRLTGIVVDSIHMAPLSGARITVGETGRTGVASAGGIFTVDSVPVGDHALRVTHPLLDSL